MRIQRSEILKLLFVCVCLPNAVFPALIHTGCFLRLLVDTFSPQIASNPVPPPFPVHDCTGVMMPFPCPVVRTSVFFFFVLFSFVLRECFVIKAQANFKFVILLLQPFKCWRIAVHPAPEC